MSRTVADVLASLPPAAGAPLPAPTYRRGGGEPGCRLGVLAAANRTHTTDEAYQIFLALEAGGYRLAGPGMPDGDASVPSLLARHRPGTVVLQDRRETDGLTAGARRDPSLAVTCPEALAPRDGVFRGSVLKDAQNDGASQRAWAAEVGYHFWVVYYHPDVVCRLAPFVRREHLVRTWHTLDEALVPRYSPEGRAGCLISGALSAAYPLRTRLARAASRLPETAVLPHPGYRRDGCATPAYLRTLSRHKVAICTSSRYGYALRKLIEATAAGCAVVTDLPVDEVMPMIDGNLHRVHPAASTGEVAALVRRLLDGYDSARQAYFAAAAVAYYDYREAGRRLAADIEALRRAYPCR